MSIRSILAFFAVTLAYLSAQGQVNIGVKVGANYVITSMDIKPDPKDAPTNPKGLGMLFGTYAEIRFSDMVGLRPELQFSFQRLKTEYQTTIENYQEQTQQGTFNGKLTQTTNDDQRLQYAQVVAPLMITPNENLRVMVGPSFGFLMGGKVDTDETIKYEGTIGEQAASGENFSTESKKGSAAIRDWRKMEVCAVAGIGYTLDFGLDFDLRYYRGLITKYDESAGTSRFRLWSNTVEFAMGWTFGK
jgi:hypothetical protein